MKSILLVEDNNAIREDVAEMLELANYKVYTACNGKEGVEAAKKYLPDLIISDIMMPVVDGFGMLHLMRQDPLTEAIPFIFLTAKTDRNDFRNAMESGADDFISKPFNNDELLKSIENRFRRIDIVRKSIASGLKELNNLVSSVNSETLEALTLKYEPETYAKKQEIYREGQTPKFLFFILTGKVRTYKVHDDGKQLVVGLYNKGEFFGHIALLEEATYSEIAQAMEETELVPIPRKDFEELLHKNPAVGNKLIKLLAKNVSENEKQLLCIAYNTLRKKVASALIHMQNKYKVNKNEPYFIDLSRDDLAAIAGTATESLIRSLSEFKQEKLIDIGKDNRIEIKNPGKLENLLR